MTAGCLSGSFALCDITECFSLTHLISRLLYLLLWLLWLLYPFSALFPFTLNLLRWMTAPPCARFGFYSFFLLKEKFSFPLLPNVCSHGVILLLVFPSNILGSLPYNTHHLEVTAVVNWCYINITELNWALVYSVRRFCQSERGHPLQTGFDNNIKWFLTKTWSWFSYPSPPCKCHGFKSFGGFVKKRNKQMWWRCIFLFAHIKFIFVCDHLVHLTSVLEYS